MALRTVPVTLGQARVAERVAPDAWFISFTNPAGLQAMSDNYLQETGASGPAQVGNAGTQGRGTISQGMLEQSNVNVVQELVDMIECQRAYEINSKMISSVDEMLKNANQTL